MYIWTRVEQAPVLLLALEILRALLMMTMRNYGANPIHHSFGIYFSETYSRHTKNYKLT